MVRAPTRTMSVIFFGLINYVTITDVFVLIQIPYPLHKYNMLLLGSIKRGLGLDFSKN